MISNCRPQSRRRVWCQVIGVVGIVFVTAALAASCTGAANAAHKDSYSSTPAKTKTEIIDILANDPLLTQRIRLEKQAPLAEILTLLGRNRGVYFTVGSKAAPHPKWMLQVRFEDITLREAMDAVAASGQWRWERIRRNVYELREADSYYDSNLPLTSLRKERWRLGKAFLDSYSKLPPDTQKVMLFSSKPKPQSFEEAMRPPGVLISALPPAMQEQIKDLALNMSTENAQDGSRPFFSPADNFGSYNATLEPVEYPDMTQFRVSVAGNNREMTLSFNDLPERLKAQESENGNRPLYNPKDFRLKPPSLPAGLHGEATISLSLEKATIADAGRVLANALREAGGTGNFIADVGVPKQKGYAAGYKNPLDEEAITSELTEVPVSRICEKMQALYPGSEWEMRPGGTLVVRSRLNSGIERPTQ